MTLSLSAGRAPSSARSTRRCSSSRCPAARRSTAALAALDATLGGALAARARRAATSAAAATRRCTSPAPQRGPQRVLLVGLGQGRRTARLRLRRAGALAARQAQQVGVGELAFFAGALDATRGRSDRRRTRPPARGTTPIRRRRRPADERARAAHERARSSPSDGAARSAASRTASAHRRGPRARAPLGMMPGNICTPDYLADTARDIATAPRHEGHGARPRRDGAREDGHRSCASRRARRRSRS